jgi:hypothetical protein
MQRPLTARHNTKRAPSAELQCVTAQSVRTSRIDRHRIGVRRLLPGASRQPWPPPVIGISQTRPPLAASSPRSGNLIATGQHPTPRTRRHAPWGRIQASNTSLPNTVLHQQGGIASDADTSPGRHPRFRQSCTARSNWPSAPNPAAPRSVLASIPRGARSRLGHRR